MKTAILSAFHPFRGGIAQFNGNLYLELGKTADVKAFNYSRQYPGFLFPGKTQYVSAGDDSFPMPSEAVLDTANPFNWPGAARKILRWQPDLLLMRYVMPYFAPSLGCVARKVRRSGCKVVAIADNIIPHEKHIIDKPFTKYFLGGLDGCVTLCDAVAEDLHRWAPDLPSKVIFHPLYSHFGEKLPREEAERTLGLRPGMKNLLFFGLIREYKGLDILLEAFNSLPEDYQLIIAGECYGPFDKYQAIIDASPAKDRIHLFRKYIDDSEVKVYFSAADVTVLPYRSATQSGVSSASYHFEVPMIVTAVGGLKETIGDTGTGLVADKPSPAAVAGKITEFFGDDSIRRNCVESIRRESERLSWKRFSEELLNFAAEL
ncbi:MAG: glycosyltransferase [Bacteroidales bacterium]|nr:glycosyltransferase [Bacteroidales bacterium]